MAGEARLADGAEILAYLRATAADLGLDRAIRLRTRVLGAAWSSARSRWTVETADSGTGERRTLTCAWLVCATGYFRYDEGHTPYFEGSEKFRGRIVHPQHWPADLDHAGKRVVVIGSGATAVTLVPALADTAAHVTMLQRTPSYILAIPARDRVVAALRRAFGDRRAHTVARTLYLLRQQALWLFCQRFPAVARWFIRRCTARRLPAGYPVDLHFNPPYGPWDQRLCLAPGGDLFAAISRGTASVRTDTIATFTEDGLLLASGERLAADIIVTATGLNVEALGDVRVTVDDTPVNLADTVVYKGLLLSGVPNLAYLVGYTHASWTLRIGLSGEYLSRLLTHMDAHGHTTARPEVGDPPLTTRPFLDLAAGYLTRVMPALPRQGDRAPWRTSTDYLGDVRLLRHQPIENNELRMS